MRPLSSMPRAGFRGRRGTRTSCAAAPPTASRWPSPGSHAPRLWRRPDALGWHVTAAILARAAHPFQRQLEDVARARRGDSASGGDDPCLGRWSPAAPASWAPISSTPCSTAAGTSWGSTASTTTTRPRTARQPRPGDARSSRRADPGSGTAPSHEPHRVPRGVFGPGHRHRRDQEQAEREHDRSPPPRQQ